MTGMDEDGGGERTFDVDDFDFDGIPDNALLELEQNAIQSTLRHPNEASTHGLKDGMQAQPESRRSAHSNIYRPYQPSINRGQLVEISDADGDLLFDQDIPTPTEEKETFIPQRFPGEMTQRELWRQERYGGPTFYATRESLRPVQQQSVYQTYQQPSQPQSGYRGQTQYEVPRQSVPVVGQTAAIPSPSPAQEQLLRAQLEQFRRERDELTKELNSTKTTIMTQKGEIAIIRANQERESKVFDRELAALKKSRQEDSTKHTASIESINREMQRIATENTFLKQDLAEEGEKNRALHRSLKDKPPVDRSKAPTTTPQKQHEQSLRDGFDDGEIMPASPIKSGRRSKVATPTAGGKRKRKVDTSPMAPLVLRQSGKLDRVLTEPQPTKVDRLVPITRKDATAEKNFRFLQRILSYRIPNGKDCIIEAFMRYSFPSEGARTFTTIIVEATKGLSGGRYPADLLGVFIDLWSRSLKEKYFECIPSLIEVVRFIIALERSVIDKGTIESLLPVLQSSGEINAMIRFNYSPVSRKAFGQSRQTPQSELNRLVNGNACLEMLVEVALHCLEYSDSSHIELFWRSISTDFVLMMLNSSQPISDISLMLHLLSTSIRPNTFGCISDDETDQAKMENYIIDRVCYLLWESPRVDEDVEPYAKAEVCSLRLEAMTLLSTLSLSGSPHPHSHSPSSSPTTTAPAPSHGSLILATHPAALARLTRSLSDELTTLYTRPPTHRLHATLINDGVRLLYHILSQHGADVVDMRAKLGAVNGGSHKHRVMLTRLAFSDGLLLDADITDDTVLMARDMLEESVTPEEAEQLLELFPSYRALQARGSHGAESQLQPAAEADGDEEMEMELMDEMEMADPG